MKLGRLQVSPRAAVEVWLWRNGWTWPATLLLAAVAAGLCLAVIQPQRAHLAELGSQLQRARDAAAGRDAAHAKVPPTAADARAVVIASPPTDRLVARMVQLAQAEGVGLPQAEYQQRALAGSDMVQVQITQPVRATYPQLRRYVEAVLRTIPNASLDQLAARRENVGQPQLDARLRWSLWLPRATPPASASGQERPTP
jgi:hypothetical protein